MSKAFKFIIINRHIGFFPHTKSGGGGGRYLKYWPSETAAMNPFCNSNSNTMTISNNWHYPFHNSNNNTMTISDNLKCVQMTGLLVACQSQDSVNVVLWDRPEDAVAETKPVPTSQDLSEEDQACTHLSGSIRGRPSLYPPLRIYQRKTKPVPTSQDPSERKTKPVPTSQDLSEEDQACTHLSESIRGRPSLYPPLRIYQRKTKHVPTSPDLLEEGQDCTHLRNW